jgi:alpha-ketoglutaric semialdehyde dehydrogenase
MKDVRLVKKADSYILAANYHSMALIIRPSNARWRTSSLRLLSAKTVREISPIGERNMTATIQVCSDQAFQNFIGGRWVTGANRGVIRRNPADLDDVIGHVPLTSKAEVSQAVEAALRANEKWQQVPAPARGKLLLRVARLLEERAELVATQLTREEGKTLEESRGEVEMAVKVLEYIAGDGRRLAGETLPSEQCGRFVYTIRQPVGVVGLITPWNFPLAVPIWKIAPALVGGNTVVWKPSRLTPSTSQNVALLFADAGLPDGVLNLVHGAGSEAGSALVEHPAVRAISFTSSFEVGAQIYSQAARLFKKVQCEAGGKNAAIVLPHADLQLAADCVIAGAFRYTGQRCTATSRVIVTDSIAKEFSRMLVERAHSIVVGNGMDAKTFMGPIADELQIKRVAEFLQIGREEGELVCGGSRMTGPAHDRGLFVSPTIFDHVKAEARLAQEEIFGPVLSIIRVAGLSEAISAANANRYGMAASVFSRNTADVFEAAEKLECGVVHINGATIGAEVHVPFGGIKDTGVGEREIGSTAKEFYTELKVVYVNKAG